MCTDKRIRDSEKPHIIIFLLFFFFLSLSMWLAKILHWNFRIKDTLGPAILSFVREVHVFLSLEVENVLVLLESAHLGP